MALAAQVQGEAVDAERVRQQVECLAVVADAVRTPEPEGECAHLFWPHLGWFVLEHTHW